MKKINIPIHKHTPKRYSMSFWLINIDGQPSWAKAKPLVTDLQRVPKRSERLEITLRRIAHSQQGIVSPLFNSKDCNQTPTKKLGIFKNIWQNKIRNDNEVF